MPDAQDTRRCVVVTGAAGAIGSLVVRTLSGQWRIRATDVRPQSGVKELDVTDPAGCREMFRDVDAVVHLAADPDPEAGWARLHGPNVEGTYVVASAARDEGVRRLVLASSLQAVSAYPPDRQRRADDPARPANLYGATKAWAEALGAWVAATSQTSVVALRIGYFSEHPPAGMQAHNVSAWLSPADCTRLIRAAVESDLTGLTIVNGISANRYRGAELGDAERQLGYTPADDAWEQAPTDHAPAPD